MTLPQSIWLTIQFREWNAESIKVEFSNLVSAVLRGIRQTAQDTKGGCPNLNPHWRGVTAVCERISQLSNMCGSSGLWWKLRRIFQPCLVDHGYILTLVFKVVLAQPAIISITCWFLRRVPCAAELITASVLNKRCSPPALTFCPAPKEKHTYYTHTLASTVKPLNQLIFIPLMFPLTPSIPIRLLPAQTLIKLCWWVILWKTDGHTHNPVDSVTPRPIFWCRSRSRFRSQPTVQIPFPMIPFLLPGCEISPHHHFIMPSP